MIKIDYNLISKLSKKSKDAKRLRINYNFHKNFKDPINRMLNVVQPGSYIRPHKHENPDKVEIFILLKGKILVLEYDDFGKIKDFAIVGEESKVRAVEIPPREWHSFIALKKDTVIYEIKNGPYNKKNDKKYPDWAPEEDSKESKKYLNNLLNSFFQKVDFDCNF